MGYNSTLVIYNDHISSIGNRGDFGKEVQSAVLSLSLGRPVHLRGGGGVAVETHHADTLVPVLVGGNYGQIVDAYVSHGAKDPELELLKELAKKRGFALRRRPENE